MSIRLMKRRAFVTALGSLAARDARTPADGGQPGHPLAGCIRVPLPPESASFPAPPWRISLPSPPLSVSSPVRPTSRLLNSLPVRISPSRARVGAQGLHFLTRQQRGLPG